MRDFVLFRRPANLVIPIMSLRTYLLSLILDCIRSNDYDFQWVCTEYSVFNEHCHPKLINIQLRLMQTLFRNVLLSNFIK